MNDVSNNTPKLDPFDLEALRKRGEAIAKAQGFLEKNDIDAFRHGYSNAMITWQNGAVAGLTYANVLGILNEAQFLLLGIFYRESINSSNILEELGEAGRDIFNNNAGFAIGLTATSEEDIITKIAAAVRSGDLLKKQEDSGAKINNSFVSDQSHNGDIRINIEQLAEKILRRRSGSQRRGAEGQKVAFSLFEKLLMDRFSGEKGRKNNRFPDGGWGWNEEQGRQAPLPQAFQISRNQLLADMFTLFSRIQRRNS